MLLEVKDLHVSYGEIKAIRGINFNINQGEIVTIIGSNGAGKSTTLNSLAGLIKPASGTVLFNGEDVTKLESYELVKKGISLSPEGRQIFPRMSVIENLELGGYFRTRAELEKGKNNVFELFPILKERSWQAGGTLSGGEQQMLAIGRALMASPKILILDEPSLGLAPIIVKEIFKMIRKIRDEGITVLLVEQNAKMALSISDRGYVLETGKIRLEGKSEELLNNEEVHKLYLGGI
ncbi:ABC transporter ATP-binding protein [Treponema putidum]|uniref:ABC transporter ATP-binding protein n=1 Tax=Treponema putidum TaxID=221027 RepID=A0AAE9SGR3_9SPIR|nr:ABC transporter ATP-binding protein [Treponema putidum]AIN94148.1 amino acid ABC transporter ATPase [Treponema putidum]TWI79609.1 amino acid/amide ABC transporter ATP-binding protein 2 (HAAT family) [Treponema putidum]UTY30596.1 ABC transporter ATP-binding protein [Treponema putidum]UTY33003.1 ABC transporter ATP-binding protein [Treponema putidum]